MAAITGAPHGAATRPETRPMTSTPVTFPPTPADAARGAEAGGDRNGDQVGHHGGGREHHVGHHELEPRVRAHRAEHRTGEASEQTQRRIGCGQPDHVMRDETDAMPSTSRPIARPDDGDRDRDHWVEARR